MIPELSKLCRTCLAPDNHLISIFDEEDPKNNSFRCAADIIGNLTNMPTKSDGLPELVCLSCSNEIKKIHSFAMKCFNSECILRKILEDTDKEKIKLRYEDNIFIGIDQTVERSEEDTDQIPPVPTDFLIIESEEPSCSFFVENQTNTENNRIFKPEPNLCEQYIQNHVSEVKPTLNNPNTNASEVSSSEVLLQIDNEEKSKLKCPNCHKVFKYLARLKKHIKNFKCTGQPVFSCSICDKKYNRQFSLQRHCLISHKQKLTKENPKEKTISPEGIILEKMKDGEYKLNMEVKQPINNEISNIEAMRQCNHCKEVFENDEALTLHKSLVRHKNPHAMDKSHICELCGKAFSFSHNLKIHVMVHKEIKPFKCGQCNQTFVTNSCLNRHLKWHTGDRPFTCESCGKGFPFMHSLKKHEQSHKEERPYSCTVCSKRFKLPNNLKDHHRMHSGEKPYACKICPRKLSSKANLKVHMKSHDS